MCLLVVKKQGTPLPPQEYLCNAAKRNKDGIGIARWREGDTDVLIKKDFEGVEHLWSWINSHSGKEDALMIHFRWASSGDKTVGNRHPFPITSDWDKMQLPVVHCSRAIAHNGVLSQFHTAKSTYSDTMHFIAEVMAPANGLESNQGYMKLLRAYLSNQRIATLNRRGEWKLFGGGWVFDEELMWSNSLYKWSTITTAATDANYTWGDTVSYTECDRCGEWRRVFSFGSGERLCAQCLSPSSYKNAKEGKKQAEVKVKRDCEWCCIEEIVTWEQTTQGKKWLCGECRELNEEIKEDMKIFTPKQKLLPITETPHLITDGK